MRTPASCERQWKRRGCVQAGATRKRTDLGSFLFHCDVQDTVGANQLNVFLESTALSLSMHAGG